MPTRSSRPKPPDPRQVPMSLEEYGDHLDGIAGRSLMFAETVVELAAVRNRAGVLSKRRTQIHDMVKENYARGMRGDGRWWLRETVVAPTMVRTVQAAAVQKADRKLWEQCRVVKPWVSINHPDDVAPSAGFDPLRMPQVPRSSASAGTLLDAYKHAAFSEIKELRERETQLKLDLRILAGEVGWDGEEKRFTDGWAVATTRREFDAGVLKRIDPATYRKLETTVERGGGTRLVIMDAADAMDKGYLEVGDVEFAD